MADGYTFHTQGSVPDQAKGLYQVCMPRGSLNMAGGMSTLSDGQGKQLGVYFYPEDFHNRLRPGDVVAVEKEYIRIDSEHPRGGFRLQRGWLGTEISAHPDSCAVEQCGPPIRTIREERTFPAVGGELKKLVE